MTEEQDAPRWIRPALCALLLLHGALTVHWLMVDRSMAYLAIQDHYARAVNIRKILALPQPPPTFEVILRESGYRPALPFVLALPGMAVWGESVQAAAVFNPLWMMLLLWAVYRLGERWSDAQGGLLAALLLGACPIVLGHRGLFLPFLPQAACVAAAALALLSDAERPRLGMRCLGGALVGLGLLCRWETGVYAVGIGLGVIATGEGERLARLKRLVGAAAVTVLVAGPWYVLNFRKTIDLYVSEGILSTAHRHEQYLELWSLANLAYYPERLFAYAMAPVLAGLSLVGLGAVVARKLPGRGALVGWICLPWLAYMIIPMKSARYVIAILPALCLALAIAARHAPRKRAVAGAITAVALLQMGYLLLLPGARWGGLQSTPTSRGYVFTRWEDALDYGAVRPYRSPDWQEPLERVFDAIAGGRGALLIEEPINTYTIPIKATSRAPVVSSLGLFEQPGPVVRRMLRGFSHVIIAGPLAKDPEGYYRTHTQQRRFLHPVLRDLEQRQLLIRATLPDGHPLLLYGSRR